MKFNKSIAIPAASAAILVSTWVGMAWADDTSTNQPTSVPFTTEQVMQPASPSPSPTTEEVVMATPTPAPAPKPAPDPPAPQPGKQPPWTPIPQPDAGQRQPASPPQGKRWQEGDGCDMSVRACTAVDVTDPVPEGCMVYDNINHVCVQWKDSA